MMIKRYEEHPDGGMREDELGAYVRFEDYLGLAQRALETLQAVSNYGSMTGDDWVNEKVLKTTSALEIALKRQETLKKMGMDNGRG